MGKIRDKLLKLKQEVNSVGCSFLMLYIKLDFIEKMELEADNDWTFREALAEIEKLADKALKNIEDYGTLTEIKNKYSEIYILSKLRALLNIEKIRETSSKTPDYKIKFRGNDIYIELKSLNMLGGNLKHKDIMAESLDSKINAEEQIKGGRRVGMGEQVIQPYLSQNKDYNPRSVRLVIESLIDKISQNIKEDQYKFGDTVLLVDLSDQLPLISKPSQAIQEKWFDDMGNTYVSGELWNVAFGKLEEQIYKPAEFEGADNLDGKLTKEGILLSYPIIKGIIFHANERFYSIAEIIEANLNVIHFLEYLSKNHYFKVTKPLREKNNSQPAPRPA